MVEIDGCSQGDTLPSVAEEMGAPDERAHTEVAQVKASLMQQRQIGIVREIHLCPLRSQPQTSCPYYAQKVAESVQPTFFTITLLVDPSSFVSTAL